MVIWTVLQTWRSSTDDEQRKNHRIEHRLQSSRTMVRLVCSAETLSECTGSHSTLSNAASTCDFDSGWSVSFYSVAAVIWAYFL